MLVETNQKVITYLAKPLHRSLSFRHGACLKEQQGNGGAIFFFLTHGGGVRGRGHCCFYKQEVKLYQMISVNLRKTIITLETEPKVIGLTKSKIHW